MLKLRLGFVTNSSSTNHTIMWKGDKQNLKEILIKHKNIFPTSLDWGYAEYSITSEEIIDAIMSMLHTAQEKSDIIKELEERLISAHAWVQKEANRSHGIIYGYAAEEVAYVEKILDAAKNGDFDWKLDVSFGDNHGDFEGGALGNIMDYEGRYIRLDEKDVYYTTEQNR